MNLISDGIRAFGPAINKDAAYVDLTLQDVSINGVVTATLMGPGGVDMGVDSFTLEELLAQQQAGLVIPESGVPDDGVTSPDLPAGTIGWGVVTELYDLYDHTGDADFLNAARDAFRGLNFE